MTERDWERFSEYLYDIAKRGGILTWQEAKDRLVEQLRAHEATSDFSEIVSWFDGEEVE